MAPQRLFVPGLSHHIFHRGNNKTAVFEDDIDRTMFLMLLRRACLRTGVAVHNYTLMDNHYHAIVTSPEEDALPRTMQRLGRTYVRYFNDRYERTGTLWEGRYHASLITSERFFEVCMRYVETNPVNAHLVPAPESFAWSSYHHYAFGAPDPIITPHSLYAGLGDTPERRQMEWRTFCAAPLTAEQLAIVREALRTNSSLPGEGWAETHMFQPRPLVVYP